MKFHAIRIPIKLQIFLPSSLAVVPALLALALIDVVTTLFVRPRVRFPALPNFLCSSGSGTGSTQPL
jgi:hypothetical protein